MTTPLTLPKFEQQLILAVLMPRLLHIWLDNTDLSTTVESLADLVRRLDANPAELQWATASVVALRPAGKPAPEAIVQSEAEYQLIPAASDVGGR